MRVFFNIMCYFTFSYFSLLLCMQCFIDGPYGTASREIFETEHAVLISAGIGVTPMASILQSIAQIYKESTRKCPRCHHSFYSPVSDCGTNLKKVNLSPSLFKNTCIQAENRRYMAEILPIRRKTLSNQSINQSINQLINQSINPSRKQSNRNDSHSQLSSLRLQMARNKEYSA